jgi:uncharacterized protein YbaA (DUF1428 family)
MSYIDGFVIAVPKANKQTFIDHARTADGVFIDMGATRVLECWEEDVQDGKVTDFRRAVQATADESIVFSWIEWPDKATRDSGMAKMMAKDFSDPRMDPEKNPMPFDGKRLIFGGFEPIVENGDLGAMPYVQGFIVPVPAARREEYRKIADEAWGMFKGYGALGVVEAWGNDVKEGKQTDFYRAVNAEPGEKTVFSWMTWPSRGACDAAAQKMQNDLEMKMPDDMPFDGKRMVFGGFTPVVDLGGK